MRLIKDKLLWMSYLFPWWPLQALLHTRRIIFSGPRFLLGDAVNEVTVPCMKDGVLLSSLPYFKLLWFRFARRLPVKHKKKCFSLLHFISLMVVEKKEIIYLFLCVCFPVWRSLVSQKQIWNRSLEWCQDHRHRRKMNDESRRSTFQSTQTERGK